MDGGVIMSSMDAKEEVSNAIQEVNKIYKHCDDKSIKDLNTLRNELNEAIKNNKRLKIKFNDEDNKTFYIIPYKLIEDNFKIYNYLVGYFIESSNVSSIYNQCNCRCISTWSSNSEFLHCLNQRSFCIMSWWLRKMLLWFEFC